MTAMLDVSAHADLIGRQIIGGQAFFLAAKREELDRSAGQVARIVAGFHVAPGRYVLTVSLTQEVVQFAPFEQACTLLGLIGTNADASPYDAARVESLVRQFNVAMICGVDKAVLDGLAMIGANPGTIFAGRIVWARPDAYESLASLQNVIVRRCADVGPVLALECRAGSGMHVDGREWAVSAPAGTLVFSSRLDRVEPMSDVDTGVSGRVEVAPCACGSYDPRIFLD